MGINSIIPFMGSKIAKGTTKYLLVALTEHENNSVARITDLSTNVIKTAVKNHSTGHITYYISENPDKVAKTVKGLTKLLSKK